MKRKRRDVFDFFGEKLACTFIETAKVFDGMSEPFRSGGISAPEECWFRLSNETRHFDWEEIKDKLARERGTSKMMGRHAEGDNDE